VSYDHLRLGSCTDWPCLNVQAAKGFCHTGVHQGASSPSKYSSHTTQTLSLFDVFQVSLNSDPKVVAGKIAHCSRSDCPPTVLAIGQGCLNQAIKVCHTLCILLLGLAGNANKAQTFCVRYRLWPLPGGFACSLRHTMTWHLTCPVSQHSVRTVRQPGQQGAHLF